MSILNGHIFSICLWIYLIEYIYDMILNLYNDLILAILLFNGCLYKGIRDVCCDYPVPCFISIICVIRTALMEIAGLVVSSLFS